MIDAHPDCSTNDSDELKNALLAAFGDDALSLLDDDEVDQFEEKSTSSELDSPKIHWAKMFTRSIYEDRRGNRRTSQFPAGEPASASAKIAEPIAEREARCVVFMIGDSQLAVSLHEVREIARCPIVTRIPRTPAWLRGVANLHGQISSVTDLRSLLQIQSARPAVGEKIIVLYSCQHSASTAIVVDRVIGIRGLGESPNETLSPSEFGSAIAIGTALIGKTETILISADKLMNELKTG